MFTYIGLKLLYMSGMSVGRYFQGGGQQRIFLKFFQGGAKSGENFFLPIETKKTTFFAKLFKIQGLFPFPPIAPLPTPTIAPLPAIAPLPTPHCTPSDAHYYVRSKHPQTAFYLHQNLKSFNSKRGYTSPFGIATNALYIVKQINTCNQACIILVLLNLHLNQLSRHKYATLGTF